MVKNANCPKNQYMVVKTASYRGMSDTTTCGLSNDYSCEVDVTCLVKKQCNGHHDCTITVDNNLFSSDPCPGLAKYLYFEYQCVYDIIFLNESNVSFCPSGGPHVLTNLSSGDINAKEGDLVSLLCSVQGEPPITFSWKKDQKPLESFAITEKPHHSSFLVVKVKDETSFGKYICHVRDRFETTAHTISVKKLKDTSSIHKIQDTNFKNYLIAIIVLATVLIALISLFLYFICSNRQQKPSTIATNLDNQARNNSTHSHSNSTNIDDDNYENVEINDGQAAYTDLKRSREEETEDKLYTHLIKEPQENGNQKESEQDYVNQPEAGM